MYLFVCIAGETLLFFSTGQVGLGSRFSSVFHAPLVSFTRGTRKQTLNVRLRDSTAVCDVMLVRREL